MLPPPGLAQRRHGPAGAVEHGGQVDLQRRVELLGRHVLDPRGRPGDAGIVDQHVEPAEMRRVRASMNASRSATWPASAAHAGMAAGGQRRLVDVGDEDPAAAEGETVGDDAADPAAPAVMATRRPVRSSGTGVVAPSIMGVSLYRSVSRSSIRRFLA